MKATCLIPLAAAVLFASCSGPAGMTVKEYDALTQPKDAPAHVNSVQVRMEISGKDPVVLEGKLQAGKEIRLRNQRDFIYPVAYEPAHAEKSTGSAVVPATPTKFKTAVTGSSANLTLENSAGLWVVKGSLETVNFQGFSQMGGVLGKPILDGSGRMITENRIEMPKFATYQTPLYVALRPGEPTTVDIASEVKGAKAIITLTPVSGKP